MELQWKSVLCPHTIHPAWCAGGVLVHSGRLLKSPIQVVPSSAMYLKDFAE
jgi:hypothetical protein